MRVHSSDVTGVSVFSRQRSRGLAGKGELLRSGMGRSGVLEPVEREAYWRRLKKVFWGEEEC